jgi:hypothetical protein
MQAMACRLGNEKNYLDIFDCIISVLGSHIISMGGSNRKRDLSHLSRCLSTSQITYKNTPCEDLQNLPLYLPTTEVETVRSPPAINPTAARVSVGALGFGVGVFFGYQLVKDRTISKEKKFLIILTTGAILAILGERLGNAISQPSTSQETMRGEDVEVPARDVTTCGLSAR